MILSSVISCYQMASLKFSIITGIIAAEHKAFALRKLPLTKAKRYLEDVMSHKQAIPFRRYFGDVEAKSRHSNGQGHWPVKSARFIFDLLKGMPSFFPFLMCTAFPTVWCDLHFYYFQVKGLDVDNLYVSHIQVNQAQKQRRCTYCAHGRINRTY